MHGALRFLTLSLIVAILGALAGWYVYVQRQVTTTTASDQARGFGIAPSFGSPLGSIDTIAGGTTFGSSAGAVSAGSSTAPRLWQITKTPVAGFGFAASSTALNFAERATGNILRADPSKSSIERLTNTLFPKIYDARFARDGSVLLRSLSDAGTITTFAGSFSTATSSTSTPQTLAGLYLPQQITGVSVRSAPNQIFYIQKTGQGAVGKTSDWKGGAQKQVFASGLNEWEPIVLEDGSMYVAQLPSDDVLGYAFKIQNGSAASLIGPLAGLEILPKSGSTALLYSSAGGGGVGLYGKSAANASPVTLSIRTIAEKCVWAPGKDLIAYCAVPITLSSASFLRDWFSGSLHTTDVWWRVDVSAGTVVKFFTTDSSLALDVHDPIMDTSGSYIAFRNGTDDTLWMLKVTQ